MTQPPKLLGGTATEQWAQSFGESCYFDRKRQVMLALLSKLASVQWYLAKLLYGLYLVGVYSATVCVRVLCRQLRPDLSRRRITYM